MDRSTKTFDKAALQQLQHPTPYFLFDAAVLARNLEAYQQALPENTEICYALKANSEQPVLKTLMDLNCSFEVASTYELTFLQKLGVKPDKILYGTSVKPEASIGEFFKYGVKRYAFDSSEELLKISRQAPGAEVYLRVLVDDEADSVFTMSEKFGVSINLVTDLLNQAKNLGLQVYGLSFNVGSQARNVDAWANALQDIFSIMTQLSTVGIKLPTINLGGGFPYPYHDKRVPDIGAIGTSIANSLAQIPYPVQFLAEPGRGLVANTFVLVTSVFAKNRRPNGEWLYTDAGAYNALLEVMAYQGSIRYIIELLRDSNAPSKPYILTGPTGDSLDILAKDVLLPSDIKVGDQVVIRDTGAYSLVLATVFNGFPKPSVYTA